MSELAKTYPIGIDMDDRFLTAAQFRKSRRGIEVRNLFFTPLAESAREDDAILVAALKSIRSSGFFTGRFVSINLPFRDLSVFPVRFSLGEQDDPEEAIIREAVKLLPYPVDEAIIDYPSLMRKPGTCDATIVAVHKPVMERWLGVLQQAGLTPLAMDLGISSLLRLHRCFIADNSRADLLCHIGRFHSLLAAVTGEGLLYLSEIPWGIQALWDEICTHLELPPEAAEAINMLKVYGLAYDEREAMTANITGGAGKDAMDIYRVIFQIIAPSADELLYELHKVNSYVRSYHDRPVIGTVYLYGLAGMISQLDRYLERKMEIPTSAVDVFAKLGYRDAKSATDILERISPVPALGLAMREVSWL